MLYQSMNDIGPAVTPSSSSPSSRDAPPSHDYVSAADDTDSSNSDSGKGPSEEGGDSQQLHDVSHDSQMAPQSSLAMTVFSKATSAANRQQQRNIAHVNNKPSILKKSPHKSATGATATSRDVNAHNK